MEKTKHILIIDDEKVQAEALKTKLEQYYKDAVISYASEEEEINEAIVGRFYNLVILDIRMDNYKKSGIDYAYNIIENNPFSKIIFVSKFLPEYIDLINPIMATGRIICFSEKKEYDLWLEELVPYIDAYYGDNGNSDEVNSALIDAYAKAKNEENSYKKGIMFERFIALLFSSIGFSKINKRVVDQSKNEVDLLIRNESKDIYFSGFGQYLMVECKNHPSTNIGKNDFIVFKSKIDHSNGLCKLGFIFTTSSMTSTAYAEALRDSKELTKIIFIDNIKMERLLRAQDILEELKNIIDNQVKDN